MLLRHWLPLTVYGTGMDNRNGSQPCAGASIDLPNGGASCADAQVWAFDADERAGPAAANKRRRRRGALTSPRRSGP